jgi:Uma2 family endonuclease
LRLAFCWRTQRASAAASCSAPRQGSFWKATPIQCAPDASYISRERYDRIGPTTRYWPGAPDFTVEVLSPEDRPGTVRKKLREWLAAGTAAVVVLDPANRTATVHRSGREVEVYGSGDTLDLSDAVPDFRPTVAELFA